MFGIARYSFTFVATFCVAAFCGERAFGQVLKGEAVFGGWDDDRPGLRRLLTPQDLPPIEKPIREAPNGDLFVAETMFNTVHVLRSPPGSAHAVRDEVFACGLKQSFGIATLGLRRVETRSRATSAIDRYSTLADISTYNPLFIMDL